MKDFTKRFAMKRGLLVRKLPSGRQGDAFSDQRALLGGLDVRTIFDAGAYVGLTARRYRRHFPAAAIHCFEPVPESFQRLSEALSHDRGVHLNQIALGDSARSVEIHINRSAATSSNLVADPAAAGYLNWGLFEEVTRHRVDSTTIDRYCSERGIDSVDILKLDIQGTELAALRGASDMLSRGRISIIYIELLIASMYEGQGSVSDVLGYCAGHGFRLYGLYDLFYGSDTFLYQMDAILVGPQFDAGRIRAG